MSFDFAPMGLRSGRTVAGPFILSGAESKGAGGGARSSAAGTHSTI